MNQPIKVHIKRTVTSDEGTLGRLTIPGHGFECYTLELPDRGNRPMKSRIQPGTYHATWQLSRRFRQSLYRLDDAHGRVGILIHPGNFAGDILKGYLSDLNGCIALGSSLRVVTNENGKAQLMITNSRDTVETFHTICSGQPIQITIDSEK